MRLDYAGRKGTTSVLFRVLPIAAGRVVLVFAACRDLADAPGARTLYDVLATLPEIRELEKRLKRSLCHELPKALLRKSRILALDLTLIPYHDKPALDLKEIFRSKPKSGTSHSHAYATAAVVHKGYSYTV